MSWKGWIRWMKNQVHLAGREPARADRPAANMQRNLHRLEALLEQGAGRHKYRPRPSPAVARALAAACFTHRPEAVPTQLVVIALDASNQPVHSYTGTAHLNTDPAAARPGDYTFTAEDSGGCRFSVTLSTVGCPTIAVPDTSSRSAGGSHAFAAPPPEC